MSSNETPSTPYPPSKADAAYLREHGPRLRVEFALAFARGFQPSAAPGDYEVATTLAVLWAEKLLESLKRGPLPIRKEGHENETRGDDPGPDAEPDV